MLLPLPFLLAGFILWAVVPDFTSLLWANLNLLVPLLLIWMVPAWAVLLWFGLDSKRSEDAAWHVPWFTDIGVNLAYGAAEEDGIHFRKWFRWHFVTWKAIQRVVFWPDRDSRLDLHLFNRWGPVVFMPDGTTDTADYIARKLEEAWPRRSTFLISVAKPATTNWALSQLGLGRKFIPVLVSLGIGWIYGLFRLSPNGRFFYLRVPIAAVILLWIALLIGTLFRKFRGGPPTHPESTEVAAKKQLPS